MASDALPHNKSMPGTAEPEGIPKASSQEADLLAQVLMGRGGGRRPSLTDSIVAVRSGWAGRPTLPAGARGGAAGADAQATEGGDGGDGEGTDADAENDGDGEGEGDGSGADDGGSYDTGDDGDGLARVESDGFRSDVLRAVRAHREGAMSPGSSVGPESHGRKEADRAKQRIKMDDGAFMRRLLDDYRRHRGAAADEARVGRSAGSSASAKVGRRSAA